MEKLSGLRLFFIIYFIAKIIVDVAFGSNITIRGIDYLNISPVTFLVFAIIVNIILCLIGLLLFYFLLQQRNWARVVLLIVGWLAVFDVIFSIIFSTNINHILSHFRNFADWNRLLLFDRVSDFIGLIFWGYAIYILQFNSDVKKLFTTTSIQSRNN